MPNTFPQQLIDSIDNTPIRRITGHVQEVSELLIHGILPGARPGAIVTINNATKAQVAKVQQEKVTLVPLTSCHSPQPGATLEMIQPVPTIACGDSLLGKVIDPLGTPMDLSDTIEAPENWSMQRGAPHPLRRPTVKQQLVTGIRIVDGLLSLGIGARMGLFAGPGQGKSTILGNLATHTKCDVVIICLAGERGREAGDFVQQTLSAVGLSRSVVVLATSDTPAALRAMAITSATSIAEWFRDAGKQVLLLVDSLTRVVRAKRDMDIALGNPIGPNGYPASTFSFLPHILERAAPNSKGTISAIYTVLEQTGDDLLTDEISSLLDGHIHLSKKRADAGKWPAIDVPKSISRVHLQVTEKKHQQWAKTLRGVLAAWEENEELVLIGAYQQGTCKNTDTYLRYRTQIEQFLNQRNYPSTKEATLKQLEELIYLFGHTSSQTP